MDLYNIIAYCEMKGKQRIGQNKPSYCACVCQHFPLFWSPYRSRFSQTGRGGY